MPLAACLACGLCGALLAFIWGFTEHWAGWANQNLLLLNPLCLLLILGVIPLLRKRASVGWFRWLLVVVTIGATIAWILHWLPLSQQYNQGWVALLLPIHAALAYVFAPRRNLPH